MERPLPGRRLTEILIAVALIVAGLGAGLSESRALVAARAPGLPSAPLHAGLAAESRNATLMRCDRAMAAPGFPVQGAVTRQRIALTCADLARLVLDDAPSHGFAHVIAALAADAAGDATGMAHHLAASQAFAPQEGWLAERRFSLIDRAAPALRTRLLPAEIGSLLTTQTGAEMLARAVSTPTPLRDIVLDRAAAASAPDRQRLITLLKRQANGG